MKLYTKTGDSGLTGLIGGTRISKNDLRIEAYGTIDELNSFVGLLTTYDILEKELLFLRYIQNHLFSIGSHLATDRNRVNLPKAAIISDQDVSLIETEIDTLDGFLPELTAFILPGGTQASSFSHICRTIARRAERRIIEVSNLYDVDSQVIVFVNRLSDYFFALARYLNVDNGQKEIYWKI